MTNRKAGSPTGHGPQLHLGRLRGKTMNVNEADSLYRCGKLIADFANGENTDQILQDYIDNLQTAFNFSRDFKEQALMRLPTMKMFLGNLTEDEHDLFELIVKRNEMFESCNKGFNYSLSHIEKYDPKEKVFTMVERHFVGDPDDYETETLIIPKAEVQDYVANTADTRFRDQLKRDLMALIKLYDEIQKIKAKATKRYPEIEKIAEEYPAFSKVHNHIKEWQAKLLDVLSQIMANENIYDTKGFQSILSQYNMIQKQKTVVDNHELKDIPQFNETSLIEEDYNSPDFKVKFFDEPLSHCLVKFMKRDGYSGQNRFKICPYCKKLYNAKDMKRWTRCYSNDCHKIYESEKKQRQWQRQRQRQRQRDDDPD